MQPAGAAAAAGVAEAAGVADTLGVEEEFHVLDPADGRLVPDAHRVLAGHADALTPELQRSAVETATAVCRTLEEVRAQLVEQRREAVTAADAVGLVVASAGSVPDAGNRSMGVHPNARYQRMAEDYRQLVDEQLVCACQVQVGVHDRELAVAVTDRVRAWLPVLLALSVSSPFYASTDTGYASYRTEIWSRWPSAGPATPFGSLAVYDGAVQALVDTGVISDLGMVYFDARPSARYPTVEIRIGDACPLVDDAVLLAGLGRALVQTAAAEVAAGAPAPVLRHELLRAASWRAARSGLTGELVDPVRREAVPAAELLDRLLDHVRDALADRGEEATVRELAAAAVARGTSAERQRAALARRGELRDVVDQLVAETASA